MTKTLGKKTIVKKMMGLATLIVLMLCATAEVKAADDTTVIPTEWTNVTFNNNVRYSQWIINSRINDFYANSTHVGFGVFDGSGSQVTTPVKGKSSLDYVPGLVAKAVVENVKQNAAYSWAAPWYYNMKWFCETYYNQFTDNGKKGKSQDDLNGAKMFFALKDLTASGTYADATVNGHCTTAMGTALSGLDKLNETYIIGGSASGISAETAQTLGMYGGWFHKNTYVDQMWCDGLYMGPALLAQLINEYGSYSQINTNDGEDDWDLITRLFTISWNQLYDSNTGLLYHAFTANPKDNASAAWEGISNTSGSEVYHSAAFWGRACGWYFLALVDILEQMQAAGKANTTNFNTLKGYLNNLAAGLANYQDATTGCWYQVLDEKDAPLSGNYLESSCTAIFTAAYLKGMRLGYYTADYSTVAQKAYEGCINQFMMFDTNDKAQLIHCCASAGLGGSSNRSGSRSYYITGSDVTQRNTYTEGKVLGGFILAATEYERAYQASKAILFSTDLKASYDLEAGGEITIEACGADGATITYQWYKDGVAVGGATSATIAPTASGSYYCKATSGSTTIQSSTTAVTVNAAPTPTTSYTVKFYNGETQFGNAQTIEEGATVSAPATNPTKEGYTFKGWALSDGSTARVLFPYPIYDNVNFYAVWSNTTSGGSGSGEAETIFSAVATTALSVTKGTTDNNLSDNATITGGSMYANNGETSDKDMIKTQSKVMAFQLPNSSTIFKVTLNKALEAGDKINAETQTRTDTEVGLWLLTSTSRPKSAPAATMTLATASTAEWVSLPEYTVETGDGICGETTFYIHRCVGKTVYFTNFTITREGEAVGSDITLETVSDYEDFESYAGEGKTVTFKRNFTEGNWTTLVLPFNVTAAQLGAAFEYANECELANIQSMTVNEQGTGSIRYVTTSSITANKPVLAKIKPNDGLSGGSFTANEYVFSGVTVVNPANASAIAATSTDGNVTMYGVYKTTSYTDIDEDSYYISGGKFYDWSYLNSMAPFTAYLLPTGANTQSVKSISFADNATGINETLRYENETSLRDYENSVNLAGQKVGKGYKGIVIKNGAKVVQ